MTEKLPILEVHMLGDFSVRYENRPIVFGKNNTTKAMKLLQILLYYGEQGIAREKLLNLLYVREELADASNNLRVTVHRLKKIITDAGLPDFEYIHIKKGIYSWRAPVHTVVDARQMSSLYKEALECEEEQKKEELLTFICNMYQGEFLPDLSGEEWVLFERIQYKEIYSKSLKELCRLLMEKEEYVKTLKFCETACKIYPFDEWQSIRIQCYLRMKRYKEALKEYEDTVKMFFEEMGVVPSEHLMKQLDHMRDQINDIHAEEFQNIKSHLQEGNEYGGAYYCSLPGFRDSYRLVARMLERSGQSAYLMLCNLTDGKGHPMESPEKLAIMTEKLQSTIRGCLRRGDSFAKYSPSQYLILLVGTNKENCQLIFERIQRKFSEEHKSWAQKLEFSVSPVTDIDSETLGIQFKNEKNVWS